jgi:hypothetical protein
MRHLLPAPTDAIALMNHERKWLVTMRAVVIDSVGHNLHTLVTTGLTTDNQTNHLIESPCQNV